ncbi:translocon-associated protein subunit delta [Culicoides brevitarsis]|uniref:translocon-associated protein subunit delta n=1 Tax=Culicoides brevitarsis TaxID=469753 RepID=UPI00307B37C2
MLQKIAKIAVFLAIVGCTSAAVCTGPTVKSTSFTTTDGKIVSQIAFIAEFTLKCSNNAEKVALFAEVDGKISPVSRVGDNQYQISWSEDLKKASSGDHQVNLYDEEGYAAYRKAQRSGESTANVKPLTKLSVYHPGTYKGAWIKSELLATILISGAAYLAFSTRNKLIN